MTNERAIQLLHRLQDEQFDGIHGDERREALEMAVRALEGDGDTIYRQQALDEFWKLEIEIRPSAIDAVLNMLKCLPSAQPQCKKGKWITVKGRLGNEVECDKCHSVFWYWMGNYRFCPSCGADMRTEGNNDN